MAIFDRRTKLRLRRKFKIRQKQAIEIGNSTEDSLNKYVFKRIANLASVRRFVLGWIGLLSLLAVALVFQMQALGSYYMAEKPVPGGTFREGVIGSFTNANPLYAQSEVDAAVSRLIFSGLFTYNVDGQLVPDLAEKYELDSTETLYTVRLKQGVKWHDGQPLTAKDVVYTYKTIQNPAAKSFLLPSWKGVQVEYVNDYVVTFRLTNSLSAFPQSLTVGIIPEHVLSRVDPGQLRSSRFNNQTPIGTGPFAMEAIEVDSTSDRPLTRVALVKNDLYYSQKPKIDRFIFRSYESEEKIVSAFRENEIDAIAGMNNLPEDLSELKSVSHNMPLTSQVMVFFKNSHDILKDSNVRKALVLGIDKSEVLKTLSYPVLSVNEPLLSFQVGYNKGYAQLTNNKVEASKILDQSGWVVDPSTKIRSKDGVPLKFRLFSSTNSDFTSISGNLQKQWRDLGVEVEVVLQSEEELQSSVSGHNYDALMYGIAVGTDPDVYAYWHGSQGDVRSETRLNLSEYKSAAADKALEAGRTRSDPQNRAVKYRPFLDAWRNDNPALALYQPRYLYIVSPNLKGFHYNVTHSSTDRFISIPDWTVRTEDRKILE